MANLVAPPEVVVDPFQQTRLDLAARGVRLEDLGQRFSSKTGDIR